MPMTKKESKIDVHINSEVKKTLDGLFTGSPYSIDNLPVYPKILTESNAFPNKELMDSPIMKGTGDSGKPFIAIKLSCDLTDEQIDSVGFGRIKSVSEFYKKNRHFESMLMLRQYYPSGRLYGNEGDGEYYWEQGNIQATTPYFFTSNITYADGGDLTKSQEKNFANVNQLIREGKAQDVKGIKWTLAG